MVKYTGYIGESDAKTFHDMTKVNAYGSNVKISKIVCVDHILKRMGTRLRKLKQNKIK